MSDVVSVPVGAIMLVAAAKEVIAKEKKKAALSGAASTPTAISAADTIVEAEGLMARIQKALDGGAPVCTPQVKAVVFCGAHTVEECDAAGHLEPLFVKP